MKYFFKDRNIGICTHTKLRRLQPTRAFVTGALSKRGQIHSEAGERKLNVTHKSQPGCDTPVSQHSPWRELLVTSTDFSTHSRTSQMISCRSFLSMNDLPNASTAQRTEGHLAVPAQLDTVKLLPKVAWFSFSVLLSAYVYCRVFLSAVLPGLPLLLLLRS